VFKDIVQHYLRQISFDTDKYASMIRLPQYGEAKVVLDPHRGYGQPVFDVSGARVADALGPLRAGETFKAVARDYGVSDRSLGDLQVPTLLRAAGLGLTTMREHYGKTGAQRVADTDWIELTAQLGWIAFHKDAAIRRNEVERIAVTRFGARMFCIPNANLTATEAAKRFTRNIRAVAAAAEAHGPFIYSVHTRTIEKLL
jgi:uncharacterized protein (DUF433 family)